MPPKPKRPCNKPGCPNLTTGAYCGKHQAESDKRKSELNQYYDQHQRNQRSRAFYKSRAWQVARQRALARDNHVCQECWAKHHIITLADTVHHRVEISKDWSKRLQMDNLVSLCSACHNKRHSKGYVMVKVAQGKNQKNWQYKHILLWEKHNGPVPLGHVLLFADGNKRNVCLENLMLITKKQMVRLNQLGLIKNDAELTRTGIVIADLTNKIGELRRTKVNKQ